MAMIVPALRMLGTSERQPSEAGAAAKVVWATVAACAVLALNLSAELPFPWAWIGSGLSAVVAIAALRPLLPQRTLRYARGLPALIGVRGLISAAFFGTEVYVPYLLQNDFGLSPSAAGLALSASGVTWAGASWLQARVASRIGTVSTLTVGVSLMIVAIGLSLATALFGLSPVLPIVGWAIAGAGMGFMYPRLSVRMLELSTPQNQGFNSSALSIADTIGAAIAIAITGVVFAALGGGAQSAPFTGTFTVTIVVALVALALVPRVRTPSHT
jgi:MFS family permease